MNITTLLLAFLVFISGCATTSKDESKIKIFEAKTINQPHEVIGPISVSEQISESNEDMIQGLAGFIAQDGRVSGQIPKETKIALEAKRAKYKEMIFDKLARKAKEEGADAVIATEYTYVPPYATLSTKATILANGQMIKYAGKPSS